MIFKFKISKEIKEKAHLKEGEYLVVKSLKGDTLVLAKPKEVPIKGKAILDVAGTGESGQKDTPPRHDTHPYPPGKSA